MTPGGHLPGVLGPLAVFARSLWFVAWALFAGATTWAWLFSPSSGVPRLTAAQEVAVGTLWRRALRLGWLWTLEASLLRFVVAVFAAVTTSGTSPLSGEALLGWVALAVALVLTRPPIRRLTSGPTSGGGSVFGLDRWSVTWLIAPLAVGEVVTIPARTRASEAVRVAIAAVHLGAAGVWLGTLALFVVLVRTQAWRVASSAGTHLRPLVRPVAEAAARAATVLIVSGIAAAAVSAPGLGRWTTEYSGLLAAKALVLVVAAAIAWRQWVVVHSRSPLTRTLTATMVEAGALLTAVTLAAVLVGVDPVPAASALTAKPAAPAAAPALTTATAPACAGTPPPPNCAGPAIAAAVSAAPDARLDVLLPELCTSDPAHPKSFSYYTCLAAIGQALSARTPGQADPALGHCQSLVDPWVQQQCASGVFAKLISEESASSPSADPHSGQPTWPCPDVVDNFKTPCYLLASSRLLWLDDGDVPAAFSTCARLDPGSQATCDQGMGRALTTRAAYDPAAILGLCAEGGASGAGPCVIGAVRTLVYTGNNGNAVTLCADAPTPSRLTCDADRAAAAARM